MSADFLPAEKAGRTYNRALRTVIQSLARHRPADDLPGVPLWAVVRDLVCCGSTSACELVIDLGLDPHVKVIEPVWPDPARETVAGWCAECEELYSRDAEHTCPVWDDGPAYPVGE